MTENAKNEWEIDVIDVDGYLARIGHRRVEPSAASLRSLHEAHVRTFPFENLDVVLRQHPGLGLAVIEDKFVRRGRGGYCFEHALLFAAVLERLGFDVERRMARTEPDKPGYRSHMILRVRVDGADYLADVGFGAGMYSPMPFEEGAVVDQAGWKHRLVRDGALWLLEKETEDGWTAMHSSDEQPQRPTDYEIAHHFTATHPRSPFVRKPVAMRLEPGVSRQLVGDELTLERATGESETVEIAPAQLESTLRELGVTLEPAEFEALRRYQESISDRSA